MECSDSKVKKGVVKKMTEEAVKRLLQSYSELKARKDILDKIQNYSHNADNREEYSPIVIKIQIIESALEILKEDERKIVSWHLVDRIKWSEIEKMYEEEVGTELNYSERTFKRIQKNALKKMGLFLPEGEFKEYINES